MDEGGFILDYRAPSGTSLTETDRLLRQVEQILQDTPEVSTYSRRTGLALGGFITEVNEGDFFVRLTPPPRRSLDEIMDDIRRRIMAQVPGLRIEMAKLMADLIGDLTAVPQPIEIKLFSDDDEVLNALAPRIADKLKRIPGVVDVTDGIVPAGDAMNIRVDRVKAALEGIDPEQVTAVLKRNLTGIVTTAIEADPKMIGLRVWIPLSERASQFDIAALYIRASDGHLVPLNRIASIKPLTGQTQITRENLKRMVAVTGRISGRDMGSTIRDVVHLLNQPGILPQSVYYGLGGLYKQQRIAFRGLISVFAAAVMLVFTLLLFLYENYRSALAMLSISLLAVASVFVGLWLTDTNLNITAMMGMTMIIGIVTEVSIFYYSEFVDLDPALNLHDRLIAAGKHRMRPITMTTMAAILALSPLALGLGEGAAMLQPLAIAIIAGLVVQIPLVLIVMPALLLLFGAVQAPAK
jgi:multidrug efflux pump subunit AcrB